MKNKDNYLKMGLKDGVDAQRIESVSSGTADDVNSTAEGLGREQWSSPFIERLGKVSKTTNFFGSGPPGAGP